LLKYFTNFANLNGNFGALKFYKFLLLKLQNSKKIANFSQESA